MAIEDETPTDPDATRQAPEVLAYLKDLPDDVIIRDTGLTLWACPADPVWCSTVNNPEFYAEWARICGGGCIANAYNRRDCDAAVLQIAKDQPRRAIRSYVFHMTLDESGQWIKDHWKPTDGPRPLPYMTRQAELELKRVRDVFGAYADELTDVFLDVEEWNGFVPPAGLGIGRDEWRVLVGGMHNNVIADCASACTDARTHWYNLNPLHPVAATLWEQVTTCSGSLYQGEYPAIAEYFDRVRNWWMTQPQYRSMTFYVNLATGWHPESGKWTKNLVTRDARCVYNMGRLLAGPTRGGTSNIVLRDLFRPSVPKALDLLPYFLNGLLDRARDAGM